MLSVGIVGMPNVGKSTLFNVLNKKRQALAANYPFATIEPNVGIVDVPDHRLDELAKVSNSKQIVPTAIKFIDIAGLVRGASSGEGLGNQFLAHIRECDAIVMVLRFFTDPDIIHVNGKIDPKDDFETIKTELILSDLATIEKLIHANDVNAKKGDKEAGAKGKVLTQLQAKLSDGNFAATVQFDTDQDTQIALELPLITLKPLIIAANVDENDLSKSYEDLVGSNDFESITVIPFSAKLEEELLDLDDSEAKTYMTELGVTDTGLNRLIQTAYQMLQLVTFLTSGEMESRAWTVTNGSTAPQAAGKIHKDFERGFIAAEIVSYDDFLKYKGWSDAKKAGVVRTEGKTYIMKDGDVCLFKFNV